MSEPLVNEVAGLAYRAQERKDSLDKILRRLGFRVEMQKAYRRAFCDPATGELTDDGVAILRDLARQANFGRDDPGAPEAMLRENAGTRRLFLHVIGRIDLGSDRLQRLSERMRETTNARPRS